MQLFARILAVALLFALAPTLARAQSTLLQGGSTSAGRVPMYNNSTSGGQVIVQDSGPASGGGVGLGISELLRVARGTGTAPYAGQGTGPLGTNDCNYDAPTSNATGYHYLCFSANAQGGGLIAYGSGGAASALPLSFYVNGSTYAFPFVSGGIVGPATTVVGDAACWNNLVGTLLKDCGAFVTVGGNNTWTGTNNFTGTFQIGGVTQTFPPSGAIVGTSDPQNLTNKSIGASEINSGTLSATVMPAYTGNVASSAGSTINTIQPGVVTNAMLVTMTQNALKGAATSTAVADLAVPSCSAAGSALQWTTSTGFSCGTFSFQSAGWGLALSGGGVFSIATAQPPYGFDMPVNIGLTATVGGSALTINLTGANGSAPSATNPVSIPFRSTTLATGTPVWAIVTSALNIVVPSAATLGTTNTVPFRIWIFLAYNAGVPELVVATCSSSTSVFPCSAWESTRKTTTTIDGFATSAGVPYATTGVATDSLRIIGFAEYSAGLATAGAYASIPTTLQLMGPGVKKPGDVVQVASNATGTISNGTTVIPFDNTIPQITEGDQVMTQAITPTATPNLLDIEWQAAVSNASSSPLLTALFQDATANALTAIAMGNGTNTPDPIRGTWLMIANTVASTTFRIRAGAAAAGTTSFNGSAGTQTLGGVNNSFMRVREIMGALPVQAKDNIDPGVYSLTG